jgi:hypothetical protein
MAAFYCLISFYYSPFSDPLFSSLFARMSSLKLLLGALNPGFIDLGERNPVRKYGSPILKEFSSEEIEREGRRIERERCEVLKK